MQLLSRRLGLALVVPTLLLVCAPAAFGVARPAAATAGAANPAAAATAYLQAVAHAPLSAAGVTRLTAHLEQGTTAASTEALLAKGTAAAWASHGDYPGRVNCTVTIIGVSLTGSSSAVVTARTVTDTYMTPSSHMTAVSDPGQNYDGEGLVHTVHLRLVNGAWLVTRDDNASMVAPAYLKAAHAPASVIRAATDRVRAALDTSPVAMPSLALSVPSAVRPLYHGIETYSGSAAATYADKYWSSYNPNYENFANQGGDCTNFTSQCGYAGGLFTYDGGTTATNWYPYCKSWIAVTQQMTAWRTKPPSYGSMYIAAWASGASALGKGDFIYYDWTGDGTYDHATVVVTSDGEYIDAHTTNHHHVYWKDLYESGTKCKYGETCASFEY